MFVNTTLIDIDNNVKIRWHQSDGVPGSGILTLGPDDVWNGDSLFPKGYRSLINP